jgi:hypothetical protein
MPRRELENECRKWVGACRHNDELVGVVAPDIRCPSVCTKPPMVSIFPRYPIAALGIPLSIIIQVVELIILAHM